VGSGYSRINLFCCRLFLHDFDIVIIRDFIDFLMINRSRWRAASIPADAQSPILLSLLISRIVRKTFAAGAAGVPQNIGYQHQA
jgi:hypothetical protein